MKRKTIIRIIAISLAAIAILAVVHITVNNGPGIIQTLRRMHGM